MFARINCITDRFRSIRAQGRVSPRQSRVHSPGDQRRLHRSALSSVSWRCHRIRHCFASHDHRQRHIDCIFPIRMVRLARYETQTKLYLSTQHDAFFVLWFNRSTDMVVDAAAKLVVTSTVTGSVVVSHVHNLQPLIVFDFRRFGMVCDFLSFMSQVTVLFAATIHFFSAPSCRRLCCGSQASIHMCTCRSHA